MIRRYSSAAILLAAMLGMITGCGWLGDIFKPPTLPSEFFDDFSSNSGIWIYVEEAINVDTGEKYSTRAYRDSTHEYLVLTENQNYQAGIVWLKWEVYSPFTVEFRYKAGGGTGADGIVFMFYKKRDYEAYDGGALGFVTPPGGPRSPQAVPGYGIEFDNWYNEEYNDPSHNHIALIKDHVGNHIAYVNDERTEDNKWHKANIAVGISTIMVDVDGKAALFWQGPIDRTYGGLGFSATTGSANNWHIIDDVRITLVTQVSPPESTFIWPVLGESVSDPLQNTRDPRQDGWYVANGFGAACPECSGDPTHPYHPGEDWNRLGGRDKDANLPVYAIADGEVIRSTKLSDTLGWAVIIRHRLPQEINITPYVLRGTIPPRPRTSVISSAYFHLNRPRFGELDVRRGDQPIPVRRGEVVGTIFPGTPGGPHLHFEIRANDDARTADPATNLNGYYASHQAITDFGYIDPSAFLRAQIASP